MKNNFMLSKNILKIIAAISMLIDHIGFVFFPDEEWLRIIGRLAFPIFAFSIYEGCKYTKNRAKYLLRVFILGAICLIAYSIYDRSLFFNVVMSFTAAIVIIIGLQNFKKELVNTDRNGLKLLLYSLWTVSSISGAFLLCRFCNVDYGFWGIMLPVSAEFADISVFARSETASRLQKPLVYAGFTLGLLLLATDMGGNQYFSLFALLPIIFTSNKRGRLNMKYFFYIFYPAHLLIIEAVHYLINLK